MGDVLELTIYVEDGDNINGPHIVRQKPKPEFTFKVVSKPELEDNPDRERHWTGQPVRADHHGSQRRPERISRRPMKTRPNLKTQRCRKRTPIVEDEPIFKSVTATSQRSLQQVGKNRAEIEVVALAFREMLDELGNNQDHRERIRGKPPQLDHPASRPDFMRLTFVDFRQSLESFRAVHAQNQDPADEIGADCLNNVESRCWKKCGEVLREMDDLFGFLAMQRNLTEIINGTEAAKQQADKEAFEQLKKLGLD